MYDYGYLYSIESDNGIKKRGESYFYDGVEFTKDDTEELKEYVNDWKIKVVDVKEIDTSKIKDEQTRSHPRDV